jgi:triphosphoribosyl-dephospho-CoA synthase
MPSEIMVENRLWEIASKGQFAVLLDIITPKPGNVHRFQDHPDTRFIHFASSAILLGQPLYNAAKLGYTKAMKQDASPVRVGSLIKSCVQDTMEPHGKNTLLGTILLLIPLAIAAGSYASQLRISATLLREGVTRILNKTTAEDAVNLIRALQIAKPGGSKPKTPEWTSEHQTLDYQSPRTIPIIRQKEYTLIYLQKMAAPYDAIAQEYTTNFEYIFKTLHPQLVKSLDCRSCVENAILESYMWLLSHRPDTLIQRKAGLEIAEDVCHRASNLYSRIIKKPESDWLGLLKPFDQYLRSQGSKLNPGTTADLLSAAIYISLLLGDITTIL